MITGICQWNDRLSGTYPLITAGKISPIKTQNVNIYGVERYRSGRLFFGASIVLSITQSILMLKPIRDYLHFLYQLNTPI
jgi:hypothetical protein